MLDTFPRPQLVFDWSTPSPKLSGESSRTDDTELPNLMCDGVCEVLSDDESSDWGKDEDSQEVRVATTAEFGAMFFFLFHFVFTITCTFHLNLYEVLPSKTS